MNPRRKTRLWVALAVLAGLGLTMALVLYALRANIDLFYTPGEILYGKGAALQLGKTFGNGKAKAAALGIAAFVAAHKALGNGGGA